MFRLSAPSRGDRQLLTLKGFLCRRRWEEYRCAAGRILVAGTHLRDLLLRAKHLFVEANGATLGYLSGAAAF